MTKFEISKNSRGYYNFRLYASNGQIILSSENYTSKVGCMSGVRAVIKNSQETSNYILKEAKNGKYYFSLKSQNGQIVGISQMYSTRHAAQNGIDSVILNAPIAKIIS